MPQNASHPPRHFSTAARVYPAPPQFHTSRPTTTPNLPKAGNRAGKLILPAASLVLLGVLSTTQLSPLHGSPSPATSTTSTTSSTAAAAAADAAERRDQNARNAALMDAYGDRMSLADMEKAIEAYEAR